MQPFLKQRRHTSCEPVPVASAREPVAHEAAADPPNDPPNGDDGCQHGCIDVGADAKDTSIEGGVPADQSPAAHIIEGACKGDSLEAAGGQQGAHPPHHCLALLHALRLLGQRACRLLVRHYCAHSCSTLAEGTALAVPMTFQTLPGSGGLA